VLAVLLLLTSGAALVNILRRRIEAHRTWMCRSYALVFAAVTFRAWLGLAAAGLPFDQVYAVGSWTSWMINLLAAQVLITATAARRPVARPVIT
jgi:hypothetical protein